MTKRNLLLVSLLLVFGLVGMATSAVAQTTWLTGWNVRNGGRAEGLAEATGQVSISLNGITGTVAGSTGFTVVYNQLIVPGSVVLECTSGSGSPWMTPSTGTPPPPGYAPCQTASYPLAYAIGTGPISNTTTVQGGNQLYIWFVNSTPFTGGSNQISITVRVDATSEPCGTITAWTQGGTPDSSNNLTISNPGIPSGSSTQDSVLNVDCEPVLSLAIADKDRNAKANGVEANVLTCIGVKDVASYENTFCLNVDEEYAHALTTQSFEYALDPGYPSTDVTNGTQFMITFWNVPAGVGIASKTITPCSAFSASNTSNGCNTSTYTGTLTVGLDPSGCVANTTAQTVTCTYDTLTMDNYRKESVDICFRFWSQGPLPPGPPALPQMTATLTKGPITPATAIPLFNGSAETGQTPSVVNFYNCDTNLLYPFVTNYLAGGGMAYNNLGTEIFVANTTWDPLATAAAVAMNPQEQEGTATPQSGSCTFWLFPNATTTGFADGSANSAGPFTFTSGTIAAGGTYGFDLGSIPAFAGMTGYIYAKCGFQNAHGVEYITDNYALGEPENAFSFQAIVIPTPEFYHRTPAGDGLGETADAPLAVSKFVQKLLFYGVHNGAGH